MPNEIGLDFSLLPDDLQQLAPLIARYAESDDVDRSALVANATSHDLRLLCTSAEPHWDVINAFLDDNMELLGPRQDLAIALDGLTGFNGGPHGVGRAGSSLGHRLLLPNAALSTGTNWVMINRVHECARPHGVSSPLITKARSVGDGW